MVRHSETSRCSSTLDDVEDILPFSDIDRVVNKQAVLIPVINDIAGSSDHCDNGDEANY